MLLGHLAAIFLSYLLPISALVFRFCFTLSVLLAVQIIYALLLYGFISQLLFRSCFVFSIVCKSKSVMAQSLPFLYHVSKNVNSTAVCGRVTWAATLRPFMRLT